MQLPSQVDNYSSTSLGNQISQGKYTIDHSGPMGVQEDIETFEDYEVEVKEVRHVIQNGESLSSIAQKYGVKVDDLYNANKETIGLDQNKIFPGQELVIPQNNVEEEALEQEVEPVSSEPVLQENTETFYNAEMIEPTKTVHGYKGVLHTKSQASGSMKNTAGLLTTNNQTYQIVPDNQYAMQPGTISESDYRLMIAQVAGESANDKDDMLAVASTILNRLEQGGSYGTSVRGVLEKGYFPWGRSYLGYVEGGKFYQTNEGQEKLAQVTEAVNDALAGVRNVEKNVFYYSGDGTHNYFSDIL